MLARKTRDRRRVRTLQKLEKRDLLFAPADQTTLLGGLDTLAETLDRVETHAEYAEVVPGLRSSAGQLTDFSQAIRGGLIEPLSDLLNETSVVDSTQLINALDAYTASIDKSVINVLSDSVNVTETNNAEGATTEVTATIEQTRTSNELLSGFDDIAWIGWDGDEPSVPVTSTTTMTVTVGIDHVGEEFFARIGEVVSNIRVDADAIDAELDVGPVHASLRNGSTSLDANLTVDFGNTEISENVFQGSSIETLVTTDGTGDFDATLPVQFTLGDFSGSETIIWNDGLVFDGETEHPQLSESGDLIRAIRIDNEDLRGFFSQIGTQLDHLLTEELPIYSDSFLPWVDGLKLTDLSSVSRRISDFVRDELTNDDSSPSFNTFEELRQQIETWTERDTLLSYLPDSAELTYEFSIASPVDLGEIEMGVSNDFGLLAGIDVTGRVEATGEFVLSGVFGVDLSQLAEDQTPGDLTDDDSWANHFFVNDLELEASVEVLSHSASAQAELGFIGVSIADVGLSASATARLALADQQASDGRITFKRLSEAVVFDASSVVESSSLEGDAQVSLKQISADGIPGLELDNGEISFEFLDLGDLDSFTVNTNEAIRNLNKFSSVTLEQWVDLAGDVIDMVEELTSRGDWDRDLPGIGKSVNDLVEQGQRFHRAVEGLVDVNISTIQNLGEEFEGLLEESLGLSPDELDVSLSWKSNSLAMLIDYTASERQSFPLSIDMAQLIASSSTDSSTYDMLENIVDVGAHASIEVLAELSGQLSFGVDATQVIAGNATTPTLFVDDSSGLGADLRFTATELDASIAAGPLGLFVEDGSLTFDADGDNATTDPAQIYVGLSDVSDARYEISDIRSLGAHEVDVRFDAGASISLPLYFPTIDDPVGGTENGDANAIIIGIENVAGLFNSEDPNVTIQAPNLNSLADNFDPTDDGLRILAEGLDALLQRIEQSLREQVLNQNLPIVGEQLESAADFLKDVREDALPILRDRLQPQQLVDEVKQILHDALGKFMLLDDINSDGTIDYRDIDLNLDAGSQEAALNLSLGDTYTVAAGIDFDLGLPGIGLDLAGDVAASLDWRIDVGIGVTRSDGFYIDTADVNELEIDVEVTLPNAAMTGTLGLFQISATDKGSMLEGHFDVDLLEPSGDNRLTLAELVNGQVSSADLVQATLSGGANVDFEVVAGTTFVALPELRSDFILDWTFDGLNLAGTVNRLAIENIQLDLGSFISGFAGDVLGRVQAILAPIEPIIDILTEPLPVANDLDFLVERFASETAPYDAVNLLDLASLLGNVDVEMLDAIVQMVDLARSIPVPAAGESVMIPLGEVVIVDGETEPESVSGDDATIDDTTIFDELTDFSGTEQQERFAQESASFIERMSSLSGGGFQFPFLDNPASLIGVLLGQDATLFGYQTPRLSADFAMGVTIPITGPLAIELVGGIGVDAQFAFGYDTLGLRNFIQSKDPLDLSDGFFVSDRENVDGTGTDVAEVTLRGSLEAFASLTAGIASASIGGGIYATVGANLNDNDADGKVRIDEFVGNLPLCAFDFSGSLSAGLRMKANVLGVPFSQNIATVKLLEFSHACTTSQNLSLGEIDSDGVYTLYLGDRASERQVGKGIVDEFVTFSTTIDADGNEAVEVSAFGVTETVHGVTKIVAHAGDGDDSLVAIGAFDVPVEFYGEQGNDQLVGGSAADVLRGGGDDDLIQGGAGDDEIFGGSGINTLEGGDGNDHLTGGDRDDFIDGGDGDDTIQAGAGQDLILCGPGMDNVTAGDGNDIVYGGLGGDVIDGGTGNDDVDGGEGNDDVDGGDGDDTLYGRTGDDFLHGGPGFDVIEAGAGNDIAMGGYDSDWIKGSKGDDVLIGGKDVSPDSPDHSDDTIFGNDGNDVLIGDDAAVIDFDGTNYIIEVLGGLGNDSIEGGQGDDWAHGVGGKDSILGNDGNDHLIGGDDADEIFGGGGSDWLEGGDGDDSIFGHAGGDLIGGGRGADYLDGGDDEDQLYAHETGGGEPWYVGRIETKDDGASDTLLGGSGPDEIVGGLGDDFIDGGSGSDAILERGGNDVIEGGLGNDYIEITDGLDRVLGQWGNDEFVVADSGFARIDGQHGSKPNIANQISSESSNKILIARPNVGLMLAGTDLPDALSEIKQIDASNADAFSVHLDRNAISKITDVDDTLRLDIAEDASAILNGDWIEQEGEIIEDTWYRRLTSDGVTLIVRDLKPRQRSANPHDVNGDGTVTPMDALLIINQINNQRLQDESQPRSVVLTSRDQTPGDVPIDLHDVNGDNRVSALDALYVINRLNMEPFVVFAQSKDVSPSSHEESLELGLF